MADEGKRPIAGIRMGGERGGPEHESTYVPPAPVEAEGPGFGVTDRLAGGMKFRSMRGERIKAMLKEIEDDVRYLNAFIVFLGCFFLLLLFRLYPIYVIPVIAVVAAAIAFRSPPFGTIFSALFAFPAIAYQSPIFAWLFLAIISLIMFKAFETWKLISLLFILIACPFAVLDFGIISIPLGFLIIPFHVISGLLVGSKRGALVTIVTVTTVLLLSAIWGVQNEGFMVFNKQMFEASIYPMNSPVFDMLKLNKPEPGLLELGNAVQAGLMSMGDWSSVVQHLNAAISAAGLTGAVLFLNDSAAPQAALWTLAVFIVGFIPGRVRWKNKNTVASLAAFIILIAIALASLLSKVSFNLLAIPSTFLSIFIVWFLEARGVDLSREITVIKTEKMAKFAKFGLQDLSLSRGVESLRDIGGYEKTKKELIDTIITPLQRKELQVAYGLKPPKGVLLFGPPGTGKTMLMRALAKELDIGFYYVKCSDLLSQWYGESEHNVAELFKIARSQAPCVLFFDEIDSIGKRRDKYTADDVAPRLLSVMLAEMDGFKSDKSVIIAGATNVPYELDPALLRPGRFDKIVYMPLPDKASRKQIFKVHSKNLPLADDVDFDKLAAKTERYSGADIANICHEAAMRAAKLAEESDRVIPVSMNDFLEVLEAVKPSVSIAALEDFTRFQLDFERRTAPEKKEKAEKEVTWKDVVGLDDVRDALLEAIELPLLHEDLMKEYKVEPIKGVLLFGPPGCGKTMIVKAAANELKATFMSISGADLLKMGYEGAVGQIKDAFNRAKESPPAIIFIDEIDAIAPSRELAATTPLGEKMVAQLLNEMDGVKELKNVMLIGATNRPDIIDTALLRPGRFDKIMFIHPPLFEGRAEIFKNNLKGIPLAEGFNFKELSNKSDGYSGADIASACQEAKMSLVRGRIAGKRRELAYQDLLKIMGSRRPSITPRMLHGYMLFLEEYGERR